jgi:hypothetical protein
MISQQLKNLLFSELLNVWLHRPQVELLIKVAKISRKQLFRCLCVKIFVWSFHWKLDWKFWMHLMSRRQYIQRIVSHVCRRALSNLLLLWANCTSCYSSANGRTCKKDCLHASLDVCTYVFPLGLPDFSCYHNQKKHTKWIQMYQMVLKYPKGL